MQKANGTNPDVPTSHDREPDRDRLPLRWAVILLAAVAAGVTAGMTGGPVVGIGLGIAVTGLLFTVLGH